MASDNDGFPIGGQGGRRAFFDFDAALVTATSQSVVLQLDCIVVQSTLTMNVEHKESILLLIMVVVSRLTSDLGVFLS